MKISDILAEILAEKKKFLIAYIALNALAVIILLLMPLEYTSKSSLSVSNIKNNTALDITRNPFAIGRQTSDGDVAVAMDYVSSKEFIFFITEKYDLHKHYIHEDKELDFDARESMYKKLKRSIKIEAVKDLIGVYTISVSSFEREFSRTLLKDIVSDLNNNLAEKDFKTAQKRIDYLLKELNENTNDNLKTSLTNLLNEEIKTKSLSKATPEEYIFKIIDEPYPPKERSSPGSRTIYMIVLQIFFGITAFLFIIFRSVWYELYFEVKEKLNDK